MCFCNTRHRTAKVLLHETRSLVGWGTTPSIFLCTRSSRFNLRREPLAGQINSFDMRWEALISRKPSWHTKMRISYVLYVAALARYSYALLPNVPRELQARAANDSDPEIIWSMVTLFKLMVMAMKVTLSIAKYDWNIKLARLLSWPGDQLWMHTLAGM